MLSIVTGADGLLGSHLVRELLDRGQEVKALIQPGSKSPTLDGLKIERVAFELPGDLEELIEHVQGCDTVFHLAAITNPWAEPDRVNRVNVDGTQRILDACRAATVRRLVFCGSASSFGFGDGPDAPGNEEKPFPEVYRDVPYIVSKHRAMDLVLEAARRGEVDAVVCCPTFMLGLYDWAPSSGELVKQMVNSPVAAVPPGGRNFVCASDVACGMVNALDKGESGQVYIMGGENLSYRDFFTRVAREAGVDRRIRVLPKRASRVAGRIGSLASRLSGRPVRFDQRTAKLAALHAFYDPKKAREKLDMPATPVEAGIRRTLRSLYGYGHLIPPTDGYFAGKVAVVTGGSRGVGLAVARELVRRGARVTITARGAERLERSRRELEELGGEVMTFAGDVADADHAVEVIEKTVDRFGRLDILVNNAGISMRGNFDELSYEVCRRVLDTNLTGPVAMSRAAVSHLTRSGGHLIFISSIAGLFGLPGASLYCASKTALTGFSESLRLELSGQGVHAGVVHLGFTEHDPEKRILAADGSRVRPDRPEHHTQLHAALEVLETIEKRRRAVVLTAAGKLGKVAYRLSPRLVERAILAAQSGRWGVFKQFS